MSRTTRLAVAGFGLIAVCYGLARFAYGLLLPQMRDELGLSESLAGFIGSGSFLGYCVAIIASALLTERFGPRIVAVGAGIIALSGMIGIAFAPQSGVLAVAVLLAGMSTGLASPPLAASVARIVSADRQDSVNTIINSGTSLGIIISGLIAISFAAAWREAYLCFALLAAMATLAIAFVTPGRAAAPTAQGFDMSGMTSPSMIRLLAAAFLTGFASTAIWTFGGEILERSGDWRASEIAIVWILIGLSGIGGAAAGALALRFGMNGVHRCALLAQSLSILMMSLVALSGYAAIASASLFGAAYVMLSGLYLVWGVAAMPARPATGLMAAFLMLAVGQVAGAPLFGMILQSAGATTALTLFAYIGLLAGLISYPADRRLALAESPACPAK